MVFDNLKQKGQLSIEFILILTVIILLLQIMIIPMRDNSENVLAGFTKITYLDKAAYDSKSVINKLSSVSEGLLKKEIYIPEDSNFYFDTANANTVNYDVLLKTSVDHSACDENNICHKSLDIASNFSTEWSGNLDPGRYILSFKKSSGTNNVDINYLRLDE